MKLNLLTRGLATQSQDEAKRLYYEQCYHELFEIIYGQARKILPSDWVDDGVSEVFLKIFELDLNQLTEIENLEGYFIKLARNHFLSMLEFNKRRNHALILENVDSEPSSLMLNSIEYSIDFQRALNSLPSRQAKALQLFLEGYSHEEIASNLGITNGASKTLVYRAKIGIEKFYQHETIMNSSP
ncbi:MAG: RNA polymerase sigma factor [Saprospiraceae bacterium]